jgi:hypothetical protein
MIWLDREGEVISCFEKIKILNQNLDELKNLKLTLEEVFTTQEYRYAVEDAVLLGVSKTEFDKNLKSYFTFYNIP